MMHPGAVAAYVRVSSASQSANMQRDAIERAAAARGEGIERWYSEVFTGGKLQRPELAAVRASASAGDIRRLYVYRLDRLTRTGVRDTLEVVDELRRHGCELVTVADGFTLGGPAEEIVLAVLAWAAKMERLAINERISAARTRVEAKGGHWGRPPRLDAQQKERVRELATEGKPQREIARTLGVTKSTVTRALRAMGLVRKDAPKWGLRALAKNKLRRLRKQGVAVDLRKTAKLVSR